MASEIAGCMVFSESKARAVAVGDSTVGDHRRAPRPVRSSDALWGLDSLSIRELLQVTDGNDLLGFCLEALFHLAIQQMTGILEQPAEAEDPQLPSIWRLEIV